MAAGRARRAVTRTGKVLELGTRNLRISPKVTNQAPLPCQFRYCFAVPLSPDGDIQSRICLCLSKGKSLPEEGSVRHLPSAYALPIKSAGPHIRMARLHWCRRMGCVRELAAYLLTMHQPTLYPSKQTAHSQSAHCPSGRPRDHPPHVWIVAALVHVVAAALTSGCAAKCTHAARP